MNYPRARSTLRALKNLLSYGLVFLAILVPVTSYSHHSYKGNYDHENRAHLNGSVTEFKLGYPHTYIILQVVDESSNISFWTLETHSPNLLERFGWDENTLQAGDEIEVTGTMSKTTGNFIRLLDVTLPTGESVRLQKR